MIIWPASTSSSQASSARWINSPRRIPAKGFLKGEKGSADSLFLFFWFGVGHSRPATLEPFRSLFSGFAGERRRFFKRFAQRFLPWRPNYYALKVRSLAAGSKTRDCFDTYNKVIYMRFLV
jgi:hypothetical protein